MIKRKPLPTRKDQNWFIFASPLLRHATSDYIALRVQSVYPAHLLAVLSQGNPYYADLFSLSASQAAEDKAFLDALARTNAAAKRGDA